MVSIASDKKKEIHSYDRLKLKTTLADVIRKSLAPDTWAWLDEKTASIANEQNSVAQFNLTFATLPRKTGKAAAAISPEQEKQVHAIRPHFSIQGWTIDRLSRVWCLLHLDSLPKDRYIAAIENLFRSAEINELVALYSALPLLAYPEEWRSRCAEGIRSNMGSVLEAIMCRNPYPSEQLQEAAWNQMVLKAFFTDKPIDEIIGLDERANQRLAYTLADYAHERWAASRPVHPLLWWCVGPFLDERLFPDLERIAFSGNALEQEAAALVLSQSNYPPAKELLNRNPYLKGILDLGKLSWKILAQKIGPV